MAAPTAPLADQLGLQAGDVVAIVGGGGKTSLMFALARQLYETTARRKCPASAVR
jgi:ABC-type phosphate/phosphonate transport system ATPase subunit